MLGPVNNSIESLERRGGGYQDGPISAYNCVVQYISFFVIQDVVQKALSSEIQAIRSRLVGWLFWASRSFETVFQSISGRLPETGERKEN